MNKAVLLGGTLAVTLLLCAGISRSLFREGARGIPYSVQGDSGGPLYMVPGDHLQLMYHFWLLADTLWQGTPLYRNPYEFNLGQQEEDPGLGGAYYAPFGPLFAVLYPVTGHALAWNLTGFISLWLGYLAMVLLLRRYVVTPGVALLGAIPVLMLPYRWVALLGGSPSGFGMMWPPVIMLGIDIAIRDRRLRGAWLAGAALLMAKWSDTHVFFFSFLSVPFWALFVLLFDLSKEAETSPLSPKPAFRLLPMIRRVLPLWPVALCMGAAAAATLLITRSLEGSRMESGWDIRQVLLFSPHVRGFFGRSGIGGHDAQVFLGWALPAVLLAGWAVHIREAFSKDGKAVRRLLFYTGLLVAAAGLALLSLGPRNPLDWNLMVYRGLRRVIPPFRMIRQTAKIYTVLPPVLALLFGWALDRLARWRPSSYVRAGWALAVLASIVVGAEYAGRIRPGICLLDREQQAYAAVVADANRREREPRALAIPLWPGDSHWSSLYQYYASLYRVRMLNGYSPIVRHDYFSDIFEVYSPINAGYIDDTLLDGLLERGIEYLVLHEDAFPDKVSPFPVKHTLQALRRHPRLQVLSRDRAVWSFRIQSAPADPPRQIPYGVSFPSRLWGAEFFVPRGAEMREAPGEARLDRYARLNPEGDPLRFPPQPVHSVPGLRYVVRARGAGVAEFGVGIADEEPVFGTYLVSADWSWIDVPVPEMEGYRPVRLWARASGEPVDLDVAILGAGEWPVPARPGEAVSWPAHAFFRAGYSDPDNGTVRLEAARVPADEVFYGPNHRWPAGVYEVELDFETPAPPGLHLGEITIRFPPDPEHGRVPVTSGYSCRFRFSHPHNLPFSLCFRFSREADLHLHAVTVRRIE